MEPLKIRDLDRILISTLNSQILILSTKDYSLIINKTHPTMGFAKATTFLNQNKIIFSGQ